MSDHLIAEANRHAKALPKMTLPTTKPNDRDLAWYIAECIDLKKQLEMECAAKREHLRIACAEINDLKVKVGFIKRENAALRRDVYQCPPTSENSYEGFKWRDACEELERENAALRKAKDMVELERCEMMRSMSLAQNYSEQLRADKERLDWLEKNGPWDRWCDPDGPDITLRKPIRSAIDAARRGAQP